MAEQESIVAEGINYLRVMSKTGCNIYELAEELEKTPEHIKYCIKAARDRKEAAREKFLVDLEQPRFFICKGPKGEFQTLQAVELKFEKSFTINYDTTKQSEFTTTIPVKVRIKRH